MDKYKTVEAFMSGLDEKRHLQVQKIRQYILSTAPSLTEHIKWNAPSYVKDDEDRITFNTINKEQVVKLIFHMGATRQENKKGQPILKNAPLIEWASDIRGYVTFRDIDEITSHEQAIKQIIREWLLLS